MRGKVLGALLRCSIIISLLLLLISHGLGVGVEALLTGEEFIVLQAVQKQSVELLKTKKLIIK
jgi:acyl-CoA synthetase (AMP-forming)/AMP-acid ligase II